MTVSKEIESTAREINTAVTGRDMHPAYETVYRCFTEAGLDFTLAEIIDEQADGDLKDALIYTLKLHGGREKAMYVYDLGRHHGLDIERVRMVAASVEIFWALSLIYDDVIDEDKQRNGQQAAWIKYKYDITTDQSAIPFVQGICVTLDDRVAEGVGKAFWDSINDSIQSLSDQRDVQTLAELYDNYRRRCGFHTKAPINALMLIGLDNIVAQTAIKALAVREPAGQLHNDMKDYIASFEWRRKGLTDLRQGLPTLPYLYLLKKANREEAEFLRAIFGQTELTEADTMKVYQLVTKYKVIEFSRKVLLEMFTQSEGLMAKVIPPSDSISFVTHLAHSRDQQSKIFGNWTYEYE